MAASENKFDFQIKLLLIGDSGCGKTSLLLRYANDAFSTSFITTIGIDFKVKTVDIDGTRIKLTIWDTAGQDRFRSIVKTYFRGSHGILLVYDVQDRNSFENISNWMGQIEQYADVNVSKVLVGNKCDANMLQVSEAEGQALADQYGIKFFLTSAKENINITNVFESAARDVKNRLTKERVERPVIAPTPMRPVDVAKPEHSGESSRNGGGTLGGPNQCCKG